MNSSSVSGVISFLVFTHLFEVAFPTVALSAEFVNAAGLATRGAHSRWAICLAAPRLNVEHASMVPSWS